jgi:hypothetical protein
LASKQLTETEEEKADVKVDVIAGLEIEEKVEDLIDSKEVLDLVVIVSREVLDLVEIVSKEEAGFLTKKKAEETLLQEPSELAMPT